MSRVLHSILWGLELILVVFVYGIVSQVNEHIVDACLHAKFLSSKSHDAISKQEYLERITTSNQDVQANVKLQILNQIRFFHVFLDYYSLSYIDIFNLIC